jgi:hypothetical protein
MIQVFTVYECDGVLVRAKHSEYGALSQNADYNRIHRRILLVKVEASPQIH